MAHFTRKSRRSVGGSFNIFGHYCVQMEERTWALFQYPIILLSNILL